MGERARVGANAVVTDDVPEGATMIGMKARSTLIPAEEWVKEFTPYGTLLISSSWNGTVRWWGLPAEPDPALF